MLTQQHFIDTIRQLQDANRTYPMQRYTYEHELRLLKSAGIVPMDLKFGQVHCGIVYREFKPKLYSKTLGLIT
jgi:hypothetical protein